MPLRSIDAIFIQPKDKYYVIYQSGKLWQLPRLKIDVSSWQRKIPYQGSKSHLYLSRQQHITDKILKQKIHTLDLPESLHGCSVTQFENWWQMNALSWLRQQKEQETKPSPKHSQSETQTQSDDVKANLHTINDNAVDNTNASIAEKTPQTIKNQNPQQVQNNNNLNHTKEQKTNTQTEPQKQEDSEDIFENLLNELNDTL